MAIDRGQILQAALDLVDTEGLEGLTMRSLAQALNIQAASLYWHFEHRRALLEAMADTMFENVARKVPDGGWETVVRQVAREMRAALRARRDGARLFAGTYPVSENVLRTGDVLISVIKAEGCSPRLAGWATFSLLYFVLGFVIEEQSIASIESDGATTADTVSARASNFSEAHPAVVDIIPAILDEDFDGRFEFGLDLFLRGLRGYLEDRREPGS